MTEEEFKATQILTWRICEAIDCGTIVCGVIKDNTNASAFDCLSALIKRRDELIKDELRRVRDPIIKDIIE